jgi:hypothetical protein
LTAWSWQAGHDRSLFPLGLIKQKLDTAEIVDRSCSDPIAKAGL